MDKGDGYYQLIHASETEPTLVYLYDNPDAGVRGFGFNIRDGGGFLPLSDLSDGTRFVPATISHEP